MNDSTHDARPGLLAGLLAPRPLRWSLVELCRRTTHEGWEHLQAAEATGGGVALITPTDTPWVVAARALAAWAGPLHLALPAGAADRRLARLVCAVGDQKPHLAPDPDTVGELLAMGEKVLFVIGSQGPPDPAPMSIPDGAKIVQVRVERPSRGRYRLMIGAARS